MVFKILTYNIHKGFAALRKKSILKELKEAVQKLGCDFVFLQEVVGSPDQAVDLSNQFEYLADGIWNHYAYGQNSVVEHRHHGNAILSRYPIIKSNNLDISHGPLQKRGLLKAVVDVVDQGFHMNLLCSHLDLQEYSRKAQLKKIMNEINSTLDPALPFLLCGDFNDWRLKVHADMIKYEDIKEAFEVLTGKCAKSFPAKLPMLALDRIYFRHFEAHKAVVLKGKPWSELSDHLALYAELSVKP